MTQPYISGPDPVEAAGNIGSVSQDIVIAGTQNPLGAAPYRTIDTFVNPDKLMPEIEQQLPTYNPQSLEKATDYFRGCYIAKAAEYSGKTSISELASSRVLDFDRAELSRIVNECGIKDYLAELKENPADLRYEKDVPSSIFDPIVRRVFREAISGGYFGLKDATDRFKDIYVNSLAEDMGIRGAAEVLDVSDRTVRNRIWSYNADPRNSLRFPDDCKPESIDDVAEEREVTMSSTLRQAKEEAERWKEQQAGPRISMD